MAYYSNQSELDELSVEMLRVQRENDLELLEGLELGQMADQPDAGTVSFEMADEEVERTGNNSQHLPCPVSATQAEQISGEALSTEHPELSSIPWNDFVHVDNEDGITTANDQEDAQDSPNELHSIIQDNPTVLSHPTRETLENFPLEQIGAFLRGLPNETIRDMLGPRFHAADLQSAQPAVKRCIREPLMESWNRGGSGPATAERATETMPCMEQDKVLEASARKRQASDLEDQENQPPPKRRHTSLDQVLPSGFNPQLDSSWNQYGTTLGGPIGETRKYSFPPRSSRPNKAVGTSFEPNDWSQGPTARPSQLAGDDSGPSPSDSWEPSTGILRQDENLGQASVVNPSLIRLDEAPVDTSRGSLDLAWSSNQQDEGEAPTSGANGEPRTAPTAGNLLTFVDPRPVGGATVPASNPLNDAQCRKKNSPPDKSWMLDWQRRFGGDDGDEIPDILFQWKPSPNWQNSGTSLQEDWICPWTDKRTEDPMKSGLGRPRYLKRFAELPEELPRSVPGWYLEWVLRLNANITLTDIKARIRPYDGETVEEAEKSSKNLANCLTQRSLRYRESRWMITWSPSKESIIWAEIVEENLKPEMKANNTTRGMKKLNTAQIKDLKARRPNKKPQRGARPNSGSRKRKATSDETELDQDGHDPSLDGATPAPVPETLGDHSATEAGQCGDRRDRAKRARMEVEGAVDSLDPSQSEMPRPLLATGASIAVEVAEEANGRSFDPQQAHGGKAQVKTLPSAGHDLGEAKVAPSQRFSMTRSEEMVGEPSIQSMADESGPPKSRSTDSGTHRVQCSGLTSHETEENLNTMLISNTDAPLRPPPTQPGNSLSAVSPEAIPGDQGHRAFNPPLPDVPVLSKEDGKGWEILLQDELEGEPEEEAGPYQSQLNTIQEAEDPKSGMPTPPSSNEEPPLSPTSLGIFGAIAEWNANN